MALHSIAALLCFALCAMAADEVQFFGYGSGIQGLPLFYSDGTAYLGLRPPPAAEVATNITPVTQGPEDGTFTAAPTNLTNGNWTSPLLFINNNAGAFDAAGFTAAANTTIITTGFGMYGTLLVWIDDSGDIMTKWYAQELAKNLYILKWNVGNAVTDTAVPVVVKNLAPPSKKR